MLNKSQTWKTTRTEPRSESPKPNPCFTERMSEMIVTNNENDITTTDMPISDCLYLSSSVLCLEFFMLT